MWMVSLRKRQIRWESARWGKQSARWRNRVPDWGTHVKTSGGEKIQVARAEYNVGVNSPECSVWACGSRHRPSLPVLQATWGCWRITQEPRSETYDFFLFHYHQWGWVFLALCLHLGPQLAYNSVLGVSGMVQVSGFDFQHLIILNSQRRRKYYILDDGVEYGQLIAYFVYSLHKLNEMCRGCLWGGVGITGFYHQGFGACQDVVILF